MSDRAVRTEAELDAPAERVWEILMDPHRLGDWVTTHKGLGGDVPDRLEEGSTFAQELKLAGTSFTVEWTVREYERPVRAAWAGSGPAGSSARVLYELEAIDDDRTRFTYENKFELPGGIVGKAAARAVGERVARGEAERSLDNLASLFEAEAG